MPRKVNTHEYLEENLENGVWPDNTTQPTRYEGFAQEIVKRTAEGYFDDLDEIRLLDIGSSTGEATEGLATALEYHSDLEVETFSYDIDHKALETNREYDHTDHQLQGAVGAEKDAEGEFQDRPLPFRDGSFDLVVSKTLLSRFTRPQDQSAALREIERVVRDDGLAAVEIDPQGSDRVITGNEYALEGRQFRELADETNGFSDYPLPL